MVGFMLEGFIIRFMTHSLFANLGSMEGLLPLESTGTASAQVMVDHHLKYIAVTIAENKILKR